MYMKAWQQYIKVWKKHRTSNNCTVLCVHLCDSSLLFRYLSSRTAHLLFCSMLFISLSRYIKSLLILPLGVSWAKEQMTWWRHEVDSSERLWVELCVYIFSTFGPEKCPYNVALDIYLYNNILLPKCQHYITALLVIMSIFLCLEIPENKHHQCYQQHQKHRVTPEARICLLTKWN